jgi:amino acid transporter
MESGATAAAERAERTDQGTSTALKAGGVSTMLLLFFIVGDMIGAGIFALVGTVAAETGGAIWTAFLLALTLAVFTAAAYAELVTKYPRAGGAATYVNRAYRNHFLTFIVAFAVMCSGITSAATLSRAFAGDYFSQFIDLPLVPVALAFLLLVGLINFRGISESVRLNLVLTIGSLIGLALIVLIGIVALFGPGDAEPARNFEFQEGSSVFLAVLGGAALAFYALIGFEDSVNVAEETAKPGRAFPIALFGGLLIAGTVYMLVTFTASMIVPTQQLVESNGPLLEVVREGPLDLPLKLFAAVALMAVANGALLNMVMASRLVYGMSSQGIIPRILGRVHAGRGTPWVAIIFTTALGLFLILTGDLSTLAGVTVTLLLFVFIVVNATVLVLRRDPVAHEHFRAPTILPVLGVIVCVGLLTQRESDVWLRAGGLLLLGVILYFVNRALSGPPQQLDADRIG